MKVEKLQLRKEFINFYQHTFQQLSDRLFIINKGGDFRFYIL